MTDQGASPDRGAPSRSLVRQRFREFLLAIAVLHTAAIALYYALGIARASAPHQRLFGWGWMSATVAVIFVGLQRIKRARARVSTRS